jgi:hypothetical protein
MLEYKVKRLAMYCEATSKLKLSSSASNLSLTYFISEIAPLELSAIEQCRFMQYQCECMEAAICRDGASISLSYIKFG